MPLHDIVRLPICYPTEPSCDWLHCAAIGIRIKFIAKVKAIEHWEEKKNPKSTCSLFAVCSTREIFSFSFLFHLEREMMQLKKLTLHYIRITKIVSHSAFVVLCEFGWFWRLFFSSFFSFSIHDSLFLISYEKQPWHCCKCSTSYSISLQIVVHCNQYD